MASDFRYNGAVGPRVFRGVHGVQQQGEAQDAVPAAHPGGGDRRRARPFHAPAIERLADYGVKAERKGIYRDLAALREFGVDVRTYERNPVEYAVVRRDLNFDDIVLLVDAVQSCRSLTERQARL